MNTTRHPCNYAILRLLPYPEAGEFVNVGVLVNCVQPCMLEFLAEPEMTTRMHGLFPAQDPDHYREAVDAMKREMERIKAMIHDVKGCQLAFQEAVRPRESVLRFGEVRTVLSDQPDALAAQLFKQYVRMEKPVPRSSELVGTKSGNG
jgi:hypothetical protein